MEKNKILKSIKKGDILHLIVVEELEEEYRLQIVNKYGERQRIIDYSLFAVLIKTDPIVKEIYPPLKVADLIRAVVFGNVKQEKEKKLIVSLNPYFVAEKQKFVPLGRIYKKENGFYPQDISQFKSFREYLNANYKFESPEQLCKHICSVRCDPLKTGLLYETKYRLQIPYEDISQLVEATQNLAISYVQIHKAKELLENFELLEALSIIEEVLESYPKNDVAFTIRGKIYLAMAGGEFSEKVKKAFIDFESALRLNRYNEEAEALRESLLIESRHRFAARNMTEKVLEIETKIKHIRNESADSFLKSIKERKKNVTPKTASVPIKTNASVSEPVAVANLQQ